MGLIATLLKIGGLRIRCPHCHEDFAAGRAKLFDAAYGAMPPWAQQTIADRESAIGDGWENLKEQRHRTKTRPRIAARTVRIGKVVEKIACTLPAFPAKPSECRALFEPVDYVVFQGLSVGNVDTVQFVDVKSGAASLNWRQRQIKAAVERGRVSLLVTDCRGDQA